MGKKNGKKDGKGWGKRMQKDAKKIGKRGKEKDGKTKASARMIWK